MSVLLLSQWFETHRLFQARIGEQEYCLTQLSVQDGERFEYTEDQVEVMLQEEFRLLCIGHHLKLDFDEFAAEYRVTMPRKLVRSD